MWALFLLLSSALGAGVRVVASEALDEEVAAIAAATGSEVIVGARSYSDEELLKRALGAVVRARVVRISSSRAEYALAQLVEEARLTCGLLAEPHDGTRWRLTPVGSCDGAATEAPVGTSPSAPSAAPAPPPPSSFDADALIAAQWRVARAEASGADPTAAALVSLVVGFGAGHAYANSAESAKLHAALQGTSLLAVLAGQVIAASSANEGSAAIGVLITSVGATTLSVDRLVEVATAPGAARRDRVAKIDAAKR